MKKLYVALATPSVELTVKAKAPDGSIAKCLMAFKRYDEAGSVAKRKEAEELMTTLAEKSSEEQTLGISNFLKGEIIYIKNLDLFEESELGNPVLFKTIEDTRTEKDAELLGEYSNCLDFLLDMLLAAPSWSSAIMETFFKLHYNLSLGNDAEVKN